MFPPKDPAGRIRDLSMTPLNEAIANGDGTAYYRFVTQHGLPIDYPELFERGQAELGIVTPAEEKPQHRLYIPPELSLPTHYAGAWGMSVQDIEKIGARMGRLGLQDMEKTYRGINILAVPGEMAAIMTNKELMSIYAGATGMKGEDDVLCSFPRHFLGIVDTLQARGAETVDALTEHVLADIHTLPLQERYEMLGSDTKQEFIEGFFTENTFFSNPNSDVNESNAQEVAQGKKIYARLMYDVLETRCQKWLTYHNKTI